MSTLDKAILIAAQAHQGQIDAYGEPYILHPLRVMMRMSSEPEKIVAVLHDVIDKTDWTLQDFRIEGFSDEILEALDCLVKRSYETYEDFIKRTRVSSLAVRVKIADLEDNLDMTRLDDLTEEANNNLARMHRAWKELTGIKKVKYF
nr:GTP pyrophosphokinase [candidate division Zixibacteria bacterium]